MFPLYPGLSWAASSYPLHLLLSCCFGLSTGVWVAATSPLLVRSAQADTIATIFVISASTSQQD